MELEIPVSEADPAAMPSEDGALAPEVGKVRLGPGEEKNDEQLGRELCALLFASPEPLSQARLVELLERPAPPRVQAALEALGVRLEQSGLPLVLRKISGAWRLLTDPELSETVARLRAEPKPERISAAALETLAIIAYRQPVSKAEIEAIRGVQAGPVLRSLVDRGLVKITGRAELPGQPLLYGTSKEFLERFGLGALKELPRDGELNED
jgi:segregation and condensation protein B